MAKHILSFCSKSLQQLQRISRDSGNNLIGVSVKGGGCNGLQYNIAPREKRFENDELLQLEGIDVSICPRSLLFIVGTRIKWETDNMSSGFVFDNPNAKGECGCGTTFNI
jgi:iron-sulfur cluster assembly protein